jgi:ATP-binding cassette subfamily F protein 3
MPLEKIPFLAYLCGVISVSNLSVQFGGTYLFDEISFLVNPRDRVGLVGKNGAGKSTLLKILAGLQPSDGGEVAKPAGSKTGYLPQEMHHVDGCTVMEEAKKAFAELANLEVETAYINEQLTIRTDYESDEYSDLIHRLHEVTERFSMLDGYNVDAATERVLLGLGFTREDFERQTLEFSGGWRMRVELAKILLQNPEVLLLDEPTNHLDIESIQWLEDFLSNYAGAIILVSHDRAFLDNITNRTIEITMGKIYDYRANYSKYLILRQERKTTQEAAAKNQQKYIEKTEILIDKYRAKANKAAFAQSLIKKLDKLDIVEVDEDDNASIRFSFPPAPHSGKVIVRAEKLGKSYGDKKILENVDFVLERGDRIGFVGKNGAGKTTLSKIIVGLTDYTGTLESGHQVKLGYFAQNQAEALDGDKTVFTTIDDVATGEARKNIRGLLGSFLFGGDTIEKKVKVLSGGEKNRLAMCKLLLTAHNFLVLDEPTNHLDMRSKDMLKQALLKFDGTLVVVSHDRDFLQGLTTKIFEFPGGGVKQHYGDIYEFLANKKIASLGELDKKPKEQQAVKKADEKPKESFVDSESKRKQEKAAKQLDFEIKKLEDLIAKLESEVARYDELMTDSEKFKEVSKTDPSIFEKYQKLQSELAESMEIWEKLVSEKELI